MPLLQISISLWINFDRVNTIIDDGTILTIQLDTGPISITAADRTRVLNHNPLLSISATRWVNYTKLNSVIDDGTTMTVDMDTGTFALTGSDRATMINILPQP